MSLPTIFISIKLISSNLNVLKSVLELFVVNSVEALVKRENIVETQEVICV